VNLFNADNIASLTDDRLLKGRQYVSRMLHFYLLCDHCSIYYVHFAIASSRF